MFECVCCFFVDGFGLNNFTIAYNLVYIYYYNPVFTQWYCPFYPAPAAIFHVILCCHTGFHQI